MKNLTLRNFLCVFKCPVCREPLPLGTETEGVFCRNCRAKWELEKAKLCPDCGRPAPDCRCSPETIKKAGAQVLLKICFYEADSGSAADRLILYLKDYRDSRVSCFASNELCGVLARFFGEHGIVASDVIFTYSPRSRRTVDEKGFDQAKILSQGCAAHFGAKSVRALSRNRFSRRQKGLDSVARRENAERAFGLKRNVDLRDKTVILIDDVATTGSSLAAGTVLLVSAGAKDVICASLARTESRNSGNNS